VPASDKYNSIQKLVVDTKNGYIEYQSEAGDGISHYKFALFKNSKNEIFIANSQIGLGVKFFKVNKNWVNVTKKILPEIDEAIIFGKAYKSKLWYDVEKEVKTSSIKRKLEELIVVDYHLPRYGTDIKVGASFIYIYYDYHGFPGKETEQKVDELKKQARTIILHWDREKSIFKFQ